MNIKSITLDPEGYVVFVFSAYEARADFLRHHVPAGDAFALSRPNKQGTTLSWKFDDFKFAAILANETNELPPNAPTLKAIARHGHWWWFCDNSTMRDAQPVLVNLDDKYDANSRIRFEHPWGKMSERWQSDSDHAAHDKSLKFVDKWQDCFFGPCLCIHS
jgi:hypothetical protein